MKLKVNEVASQLEETPSVIRNWIRDFKEHIPLEKAENGYNLYPPDAVAVLLSIKRMTRDQGYSTRQIKHYLSGGEVAAAADQIQPDDSAAAEVSELKEMMQQLINRQELQEQQQLEFNKALIERLDQRDNQRDKLITDYLSERRQERLEMNDQQQEKKKPWYKRLF